MEVPMKHISTKKWLLTASLFAVLAGNYSFQSSSLVAGTIDMSSEAAPTEEGAVQTPPIQIDRSPVPPKPEAKTKTEASTTADCKDCKTPAVPTVTVNLEDYQKLLTRIKQLEKAQEAKKEAANDGAEKPAKETVVKETAAEKRERLAEEKAEKAQAKKDAEAEKMEERVAKFEDKMEQIKVKCEKDLACLTESFTSALSRFQGRNSIPAETVNKYFKSMISAPLARSLYSDDMSTAAAEVALAAIMSETSEQYGSGLKKITMDAVRYQSAVPAEQIKEGYKAANEYSKQNNPQAYFQQLQITQNEEKALKSKVSSYSQTIAQSLGANDDTSSLSYYKQSYLPNMNKIMSSMNAPLLTNQQQQQQSQQQQNEQVDTRNTRTNQTIQANQYDQKMTNPQTRTGSNGLQQWNLSNTTNGVQSGQPSTTTTRAGRGAR
jgi:hypothetical protein